MAHASSANISASPWACHRCTQTKKLDSSGNELCFSRILARKNHALLQATRILRALELRSARRSDPSAPESAHQQRGESPRRTEHWLSVAEGNCVAERRGGEQPEANNQSLIKKMMNSIRPDALASLLGKGEAQNGSRPVRGRQLRDLACGEHSERRTGVHGVGGDRMVGSWSDMNQGSRSGEGAAFMAARRARRTALGR